MRTIRVTFYHHFHSNAAHILTKFIRNSARCELMRLHPRPLHDEAFRCDDVIKELKESQRLVEISFLVTLQISDGPSL